MTVTPGFLPVCCICNSKGYHSWRLIGATVDVGCQVIKCVLPLVLCESCFRKRFCCQVQTPYLCGIAVFPPVDPAPEKAKVVSRPYVPVQSSVHFPAVVSSGLPGSSGLLPGVSNVSQASSYSKVSSPSVTPVSSRPIPAAASQSVAQSVAQTVAQPVLQSVMQPISQSISQSMSQPMPQPTQPTQPTSQPTPQLTPPAPSEAINYGIDDVLDDIHTSDQPTEPAPEPTVVEDEVCFTLPFRQGGFFRTWLNSFFVINREMIIMYPNEKRNDRKRKEILLYDATASVFVAQSLNHSIPKCPATPSILSVFRFGQVPARPGRRTL